LVKINPSRDKFQHLLLPPSDTKSSGDNFFKALTVDSRGDIWLGMYDQGLSVLNRRTGRVQRFRHDPANRSGIASNTVFSLLETKTGNILVGTDMGLDEFERATGRFLHHDIGEFPADDGRPRVVNAIFQDSSGIIWCGTGTHLLKADPQTDRFTKILSCRDLFRMTIIPAITTIVPAGSGNLWLGTLGGGLLKVRPDGAVEQRFVHNPNDRNSLSHDAVKTVLIDPDGILWIGTEEGLNRYDPAEDRWRSYRTSDGLPNSFIYGLLMDQHQNLWISTNKGISRMETRDPEHPRFRNYTTDDGLQSYEFNTNVYFQTPQGEMFFGGVNGFNAFFPDSVEDHRYVPPAVLTGFKKFDVPFNLGRDIAGLDAVTLNPGESVFSFEFATLEFTNPSRNQYAYKMEGFDEEWINCGTRREARYTNLDPGEYLFRVKGSNSDGVWDSTGTSIRVIIVPPFWRTGWFMTTAGVALVAAFGGTIRYLSTRKLRKQIALMERERAIQEERQKTRERIARDLHDDLASTVGSAGLFIESVKRQIGPVQGHANELLDKTSSLLTEAEQSMSDIVWSVSPQHDTVESLLVRIRLITTDVCRAAGKRCEIDAACDDPACILPGDVRRNYYLVFKEALANAARHSGAESICVSIRLAAGTLVLAVADNGAGLEQRKGGSQSGGHGLQNMKQRAAEIGAELAINTPGEGGTVIRMTRRITQTGH
jgi:signal transduction histidine kinase/streptogramin lyase